ncbi:ribosome biogenesis GTPase Der [Calditrichota bacterium]
MSGQLPVVAIVGRPNVGKSTLFNRIIRRREAIVDPTPGVTRDRHYAHAEWAGHEFILVDTGGYIPKSLDDSFAAAVSEQTLVAAEEADVVIFLADARSGSTEIEAELAKIILKSGVPTIYATNKIDDPSHMASAWEMPTYGLGDPQPLSALNGYQIGELLEEVVARLPEQVEVSKSDEETAISVAIIGAPNSGKSSLANKLIGSDRMVVSEIAGTTRDAIDTMLEYEGQTIRLIDTAGLKRKRFGEKGIQFYSTLRSLRAIAQAQVAIVMLDASLGYTQGDLRLIEQAAESRAGVILAVNKWDLLETDPKSGDRWLDEWQRFAPSLRWVPVLFISALSGRRVHKVLDEAIKVAAERDKRISTSELNDKLAVQLIRTPPPAVKGKNIHIKYIAQLASSPPLIGVFCSHSGYVKEAYKRFVEKKIRESFGFQGVPVKVLFKDK